MIESTVLAVRKFIRLEQNQLPEDKSKPVCAGHYS